jgi:hypothetical protein
MAIIAFRDEKERVKDGANGSKKEWMKLVTKIFWAVDCPTDIAERIKVVKKKTGEFVLNTKKRPYKHALGEYGKKVKKDEEMVERLLRVKKMKKITIPQYTIMEYREDDSWIEKLKKENQERENKLWEKCFICKRISSRYKFQKKDGIQRETNQYQAPRVRITSKRRMSQNETNIVPLDEEITQGMTLTEKYRINKWNKWKGSRWKYKVRENSGKRMDEQSIYLINQKSGKKKETQWLISTTSHYKKGMENDCRSQEKEGKVITRRKEKDLKKFREKEFNYLVSLETMKKKIRLWLVRIESYYQIYKDQGESYYQFLRNHEVYRITYYNNHIVRIKLQEVKNQENANSHQITKVLLNLVPTDQSKPEEEEKENGNNLIKEYIITNHYSCLDVGSLVQDQFNPGLKCPSGSRRFICSNSSKAYRRLRSYHCRSETKVNERSIELEESGRSPMEEKLFIRRCNLC